MHKLKYRLTNIFKKPLATRQRWLKDTNIKHIAVRIGDVLLTAIPVFAFIALLALIWLYIMPIKTANIKVPVATDQASYYPGEDISGIFFGDTYYKGEVRVLREVFCKDYKGFIKPPAQSADGKFFSTQSVPRHLEGTTVNVGYLPSDIPVGSNCVLQFTNVYQVQTIFGIRHIEYQYYTQNFAIVTKERREQLECEASGRKDCNYINPTAENGTDEPTSGQIQQSSPETPQTVAPSNTNSSTTTNNTTNNTTNTTTVQPPAPRYVERCSVDFIVKINCRQVEVN
jgi:hypothetical protein